MINKAIALAVMLAASPAFAASTLTFNFADSNSTALSDSFFATGSQGGLNVTATARKFFPAPELLAGTNISALTTVAQVTTSDGTIANTPAGLGVLGGGDSRQIDTNRAGTAAAPLREALLLSGDKRFSIHSLTLNFVDQNDTLLLFGVDQAGVLVRLGFGSITNSSVQQNPGTIRGGLEGLALEPKTSVPLVFADGTTGQTTETFSIDPTALYSQYLFTTRVGGDVLFGGDLGNGFQVLGMTAALPEPGTWAMLIGGFGIAGVSLRRQRRLAAA